MALRLMQSRRGTLGWLFLFVVAACGELALAENRLEARVVNLSHQEISFRLVDEVCGELLFEGRLQGNGQRVLHLCPTVVGKGDVSVQRLDGGRDERFRHVAPNGSVMLR